MATALDALEIKLYEADFFLDELRERQQDPFAFSRLFTAFLTTSRSVTFTMQAVTKHVPGFERWYQDIRSELRDDPVANLFVKLRNLSEKTGVNGLVGGASTLADGRLQVDHYLDAALTSQLPTHMQHLDLLRLCERHMHTLVDVAYRWSRRFREIHDPERLLSSDAVEAQGQSVEDIEARLGFPRGWTAIEGITVEDRLRLLRSQLPQALDFAELAAKRGVNHNG